MDLNWRIKNSAWLTITPLIAALWLKTRNNNNRYQRDSVVDQYVRDIVAGEWAETGETISFDWNGQLINGQHRLRAIIESGVALNILIVTGLDPAIRPKIDIQSKRTVPDAMLAAGMANFLGEGKGVPRNTAAGLWARMRHGLSSKKGSETRAELIKFAHLYPEGGLFAIEEFGKYPRKASVHVAPVMAAVARAFYHYDNDIQLARLARFVAVIATGQQQTPEDRGIINWREILIDRKGRNSNAQPELYGKTCRAIQAYMCGQVLSKFYSPDEDPFPLPERSLSAAAGRFDRVSLDFGSNQPGGQSVDPVAAGSSR